MPIYYADPSYLRIVSSITLATVLHVLIFAMLSHPQEPIITKTVTFELIAQKQSKASQNSPYVKPTANTTQTNKAASTKELSTIASNTDFQVDQNSADKKAIKPTKSNHKTATVAKHIPQPNFAAPSIPQLPSMPSFQAPETSGNSDFSSLFTSKKPFVQQETQLSTNTKLKKMSAYERQLLQRLLNARYYDKLNDILLKAKVRNKITLQITLFSNGSIKNASLIKTSNNQMLNVAAIRAALSASPYPIPPKKDKKNGFKYHIDLEFKPLEK